MGIEITLNIQTNRKVNLENSFTLTQAKLREGPNYNGNDLPGVTKLMRFFTN